MNYEEIRDMIADIGLPSTYYQWPKKEVPPLPYVVFYFPRSENFDADDQVFQTIQALNVELYTSEKNFASEQAVETVLNAYGMAWDKSEIYLTDEHMYEVLYEMEVITDYAE